MRMTQRMSTPVSRADGYQPPATGKDKVALNQSRWPHTIHGIFCYTEQAPNEDGSNGAAGDFLAEPVIVMNVGSEYLKNFILNLDFNSVQKIVTVDQGEYMNHLRSSTAKEKARPAAIPAKKRAKVTPPKQRHSGRNKRMPRLYADSDDEENDDDSEYKSGDETESDEEYGNMAHDKTYKV